METRSLGLSGVTIPLISFGAGPISGLMVGEDQDAQHDTVRCALSLGVNWFDTAATYGDGQSELALGDALRDATSAYSISTKVRIAPENASDIRAAVRASFDASLDRLQVERVTLLQLHNSVTAHRGDLPTSLTCRDVFDAGGVVEAFEALRDEGRVEAFGFTGLGDEESLLEMIHSRAFTSAQVPLSLLTPFSEDDRSAGSVDVEYLNFVEMCADNEVGVIAMRVFAGGALVGQSPSPHTFKTKFFPLEFFERDQARAVRLAEATPPDMSLAEASVRYVAHLPGVSTVLLGFASPEQVEQAISFASRGSLPDEVWREFEIAARKSV